MEHLWEDDNILEHFRIMASNQEKTYRRYIFDYLLPG
jgi:hypothetical protein